MKYFIVDAYLNGTGIRDKYARGYIDPISLNLSPKLLKRISIWLKEYQEEFFNQYNDNQRVKLLDDEGKQIAFLIKKELGEDSEIEYYSDAKMKNEIIK